MADSGIMLNVGLDLETQQAENKLKDFTKKREITTEVYLDEAKAVKGYQTLTTWVNKLGESFKTLKFSDNQGNVTNQEIVQASTNFKEYNKTIQQTTKDTKIYTNTQGHLITKIKELNAEGQKIVTTVDKYTNAQGKLVTTTKVENQTTKQLISSHKELYQNLEKEAQQKEKLLDKTIQTSYSTQTTAEGYKALVTTQQEYTDGMLKAQTITKEYTDANGNLVKEVQKLDGSGKPLQGTLKTITQQMDNAGKKAQKFGMSIGQSIIQFARWQIASMPIRMVTKLFSEGTEVIKEYDDAMTELRKVIDINNDGMTDSIQSLQNYVDTLTELGQTVGRTTTEMIEATTDLTKAGYSAEDASTLAQIVALYQNTADEELSASDATSVLVSQMKAFNIEAKNAITITDAINQVSAKFAVSSGDIGRGLTQAGASLSTYGNTFYEAIGLLTAGTEIFQGKSQQVARGLNTVASRVTKNASALAEYGVQIYDSNNQLKSTYDILSELAPKWKLMTTEQKVNLGTTLAGVNQYKVFSAVMNNYDKAISATNQALSSSGATMRQNSVAMESLEIKTNQLKAEFEKLVIGKGGLQSIAKFFVEVGTGVLTLINNIGGLPTVLTTILGIIILIKRESIGQMINRIMIQIPALITGLKTLTIKYEGMAIKVISANKAIELSIPIIGVVIASVTALIGGIIALVSHLDESQESFSSFVEKVNDSQTEVDTAEDKIEDLKNQIKALDDQIKDLSQLDIAVDADGQIRKIEIQKALLEDELTLQQSIVNAKRQEAELDAHKALTNPTLKITDLVGEENAEINPTLTPFEFLSEGTKLINTINHNLDIAIQKKNELIASGGSQEEIDEATNAIVKLRDELGKLVSNTQDEYSSVSSMLEVLGSSSELYKEGQPILAMYINALGQYNSLSEDTTETLDEETDSLDENTISWEEAVEQYGLAETTLSELKESFNTVKQAMAEFTSTQGMSVENFEKLMSLEPRYIQQLFDEEGKLKDLTKAEEELYKAKIDEMALTQARTLIDTATAYFTERGSLEGLSEQLNKTTDDTWDLIKADLALLEVNGADVSALRTQIDYYKQWANNAKKNVGQYMALTDATDDNTDSVKSNIDALQDQVSKYESVISYIEGKIDDYIEVLEKEKDNALNNIDDQIDKLNELKDAYDNQVESQIEALQKKQDAEDEYWQDQIDNLQDSNKELEENTKLLELQEKLSKAKSTKVRVYREGQGFVYEQDQEAVSDAQKALDDYYQEQAYNKKLALLEQYKDNAKKSYDQQIADLQDQQKKQDEIYNSQIKSLEVTKDQTEEHYDNIIQKYRDWKDNFTDGVNAFETEQNRLLALQLTGIDFEKEGWQTRLDNLGAFVTDYTAKLKELKDAQEEYDDDDSLSVTEGSNNRTFGVYRKIRTFDSKETAGSYIGEKGLSNAFVLEKKTKSGKSNYVVAQWADNERYDRLSATQKMQSLSNNGEVYGVYKRYAKGTSVVGDNQIALIGENPNKELVLGSKVNNGVLTKLNMGSGVVNASSTKTLAGLFNQLGSFVTNNFGMGQGTLNNISPSNAFNISIGNIELPNISNGQDFVDYLQDFSLQMLQKSY